LSSKARISRLVCGFAWLIAAVSWRASPPILSTITPIWLVIRPVCPVVEVGVKIAEGITVRVLAGSTAENHRPPFIPHITSDTGSGILLRTSSGIFPEYGLNGCEPLAPGIILDHVGARLQLERDLLKKRHYIWRDPGRNGDGSKSGTHCRQDTSDICCRCDLNGHGYLIRGGHFRDNAISPFRVERGSGEFTTSYE
jgi:hypothetical protein